MKLLKTLDELFERLLAWAWKNRQALMAVFALCLAGWALQGEDVEEPKTQQIRDEASEEVGPLGPNLLDRLWVDKIPTSHNDSMRMYFLLGKNKKHPIGVHLIFHTMTYRTQEFFTHKVSGKKVTFNFATPNVKVTTKVKTSKVKHEHFDMKAVFVNDPQTKGASYTYYRLKNQEAKKLLASYGVSADTLRAQLALQN